jgi:small nuclear ribonucleoprotein (snRNP)-like protein
LIPNSILNSNGAQDLFTYEGKDDFHTRYATLVMEAKQLYCDMIDSKKISIMDARYILPRCLSTYYFMRISLKDALAFIIQRMDKQIQPETDNIIAYYMYIQILKKIPLCYGLVNIHAPSSFYVKTARTGKATNLYFPDADSDKFDWNPEDFIYQCKRDEMNGTDEGADNYFNTVMLTCEELIDELEREAVVKLKEEYAEDVELWRGSLEYLIPGDDIEEEEWLER